MTARGHRASIQAPSAQSILGSLKSPRPSSLWTCVLPLWSAGGSRALRPQLQHTAPSAAEAAQAAGPGPGPGRVCGPCAWAGRGLWSRQPLLSVCEVCADGERRPLAPSRRPALQGVPPRPLAVAVSSTEMLAAHGGQGSCWRGWWPPHSHVDLEVTPAGAQGGGQGMGRGPERAALWAGAGRARSKRDQTPSLPSLPSLGSLVTTGSGCRGPVQVLSLRRCWVPEHPGRLVLGHALARLRPHDPAAPDTELACGPVLGGWPGLLCLKFHSSADTLVGPSAWKFLVLGPGKLFKKFQ